MPPFEPLMKAKFCFGWAFCMPAAKPISGPKVGEGRPPLYFGGMLNPGWSFSQPSDACGGLR